ncbi:ABC-type enterochelin transport system ATPase subunit [Microbacterium sp. W4I20]|nr:ABC-type enterochelin transport system ATPase subunit [Microbacterium sp. W4I20]
MTIEVEALTKTYGDKHAVRDVSFTVQPGKVTGFLGPNGGGQIHDDALDRRARPPHLRPRAHRRL